MVISLARASVFFAWITVALVYREILPVGIWSRVILAVSLQAAVLWITLGYAGVIKNNPSPRALFLYANMLTATMWLDQSSHLAESSVPWQFYLKAIGLGIVSLLSVVGFGIMLREKNSAALNSTKQQ